MEKYFFFGKKGLTLHPSRNGPNFLTAGRAMSSRKIIYNSLFVIVLFVNIVLDGVQVLFILLILLI